VKLSVNGEQHEVSEGITVAELVERSTGDRGPRGVAVAIDAEVVPRSNWERTTLREGQSVELVSAIQGG
jgi:sulfur carrier protein